MIIPGMPFHILRECLRDCMTIFQIKYCEVASVASPSQSSQRSEHVTKSPAEPKAKRQIR